MDSLDSYRREAFAKVLVSNGWPVGGPLVQPLSTDWEELCQEVSRLLELATMDTAFGFHTRIILSCRIHYRHHIAALWSQSFAVWCTESLKSGKKWKWRNTVIISSTFHAHFKGEYMNKQYFSCKSPPRLILAANGVISAGSQGIVCAICVFIPLLSVWSKNFCVLYVACFVHTNDRCEYKLARYAYKGNGVILM